MGSRYTSFEARAEPATIKAAMEMMLRRAAALAYEQHRLAFVYFEDVEDDAKRRPTYVCKCEEGFTDRRKYNAHIRDSFVEAFVEGIR